jgi:endonuclease/exonuclease/phosphatase family metal-dependent hydrolase
MHRACHETGTQRVRGYDPVCDAHTQDCAFGVAGARRHAILFVSMRRFLAPMALLLLAMPACGQRPLEPRAADPGVPNFTIETFNIDDDHDSATARDPATISAIGAANADIVCLQEASLIWQPVIENAYASKYPFRLYHARDGAAGLAVLSKFRLTDGGYLPAPNDWHPAWFFFADTPAGKLQIVNVHLRSYFTGNGGRVSSYLTTNSDHSYEIQSFASQVRVDVPTIFVGDFNEDSGSAVAYLEAQGYTDVLPLYHPGQYTWRQRSVANELTQMLDHVMFDSSLLPLDSWVVNRGHSDHIPVVAHFEASRPWPGQGVVYAQRSPIQGSARSVMSTDQLVSSAATRDR